MAEQKAEEKVDIKKLEEKIDKNEELTAAEEKFLMSDQEAPAEFQGNLPPVVEGKAEDGKDPLKDAGKSEAEIAAEEKKAADLKAAQDALQGRAKAAGLPETATEAEIIAAEKKKEDDIDENDPFYRVEQLLQKEEKDVTEQDLEKYTKREKAYYYQMRRDRKARQDAEAERDAARFALAKFKKDGKLPEEGKPEEGKDGKPLVEEEEDPFKGREESDFITIKELKELRAKALQNRQKNLAPGGSILNVPFVRSYLKQCDEKAAATHADYEEVLELTEEIVKTNPDYQKQVVDALIKGEDPALKTYELIKADPEFAKLYPAAQVRVKARKAKNPEKKKEDVPPAAKSKTPEELKKEKEAQEAEDKLKENNDKPKTSGHAEGKDKIEGTDLTIEQISAMSDREFAKLPKKVRERYLQLYG